MVLWTRHVRLRSVQAQRVPPLVFARTRSCCSREKLAQIGQSQMARPNDFMLTAEELRLRSRKRRRVVAISVLLLLLFVLSFFTARPARNAIKAWQARRHAHKAFTYIDNEKWIDARNEAMAAYQLRSTEPQALRAIARFLSRTRQVEALDFWKQLAERQSLTSEDRRDEAAIAIAAGETTRAESAMQALLKGTDVGPADWLLAAQLAIQNGMPEAAQSSLEKIFADPHASEREQFQASLLELTSAGDAKQEWVNDAWSRIKRLSRGQSATALDALVVLAQHTLSSPANQAPGGTGSVPSAANLSRALESHPLAKAPQKLLALDLIEHVDPMQHESLISRAIAEWKDADPGSLAVLAAWLNGKGEFQRELDTIPLEKALQTRDLFLQHLDALGALGRWIEIKQLLEAERFPLDPVVQRMYLARCNAQLGEKTAAENNWQRALETASGDVAKLLTVANYAEKNGNLAIAETAYSAAATESPKLRVAFQGRLRIAQATGDTRKIHAVLADMLHVWPNDPAIQNDEAYMRLLLLPNDSSRTEELSGIEDLAEHLVQRNPSSLPHRILLALSRFKQNRPFAALQPLSDLQVRDVALTPSALTVHAVVLAANGRDQEARADANQVPLEKLLPEERALIQDLL